MSSAATKRNRVIHRALKELTPHPATKLVPAAPEDSSLHAENAPLEILADGNILVGRDRFERARKARRRELPTVVVPTPEEGPEMYVLRHALTSQYLNDDQRAALSVEFAMRLSAQMRHERAKRAAAVRYGIASSRPTGSNKQDARMQTCEEFRVPAKKFRQVRKLHAEHPLLYQHVLNGSMTLKRARDQAMQALLVSEEKDRSSRAPSAGPPELILGDARMVIPTLPDNHFTALMTDPPYGVNFRQEWRGPSEIAVVGDKDVEEALHLFSSVLAVADPKLRREAFLLTFVPAKHEPGFRDVVTQQGWSIIGHLIWVKNTRVLFPHLNIASIHERMILAVRGGAKLRKPISDVFGHGKTHASGHPCEKPVALLSKLIEAMTVKGEAILDPFCGTGATVVAAQRLGRPAVGIEIESRWHTQAAMRLRAIKN